jgi:phage shock protein A
MKRGGNAKKMAEPRLENAKQEMAKLKQTVPQITASRYLTNVLYTPAN